MFKIFFELITVGRSRTNKPKTDHKILAHQTKQSITRFAHHTAQCEHKDSDATSAPNMDLDRHNTLLQQKCSKQWP
jgi:hypothetical protein